MTLLKDGLTLMTKNTGTYTCPQCGSNESRKDKDPLFGQDTGDRVCSNCGYEGFHTEFSIQQDSNEQENEDKPEEQS